MDKKNKYGGKCALCGQWVPAKAGILFFRDPQTLEWLIKHKGLPGKGDSDVHSR